MVIAERFAWGHLPKTGGDATLCMFHYFPKLVTFADDRRAESKHAPFASREAEVRDKLLVLNIRRLPAWTISWFQHQFRYNGRPMPSPREMSESTMGDQMVSLFADHGRFNIGRWLRMENLSQDFLSFIGEYTQVPDAVAEKINSFGIVNATAYDHSVEHWFNARQVARIYASNPLWASIEELVYESGETQGMARDPVASDTRSSAGAALILKGSDVGNNRKARAERLEDRGSHEPWPENSAGHHA